MTKDLQTSGESTHDDRIIPIKEYFSVDGSCETLGIYVSFAASWSSKMEFLSAMNLHHLNLTLKTQKREHFKKLLEWFNT